MLSSLNLATRPSLPFTDEREARVEDWIHAGLADKRCLKNAFPNLVPRVLSLSPREEEREPGNEVVRSRFVPFREVIKLSDKGTP